MCHVIFGHFVFLYAKPSIPSLVISKLTQKECRTDPFGLLKASS